MRERAKKARHEAYLAAKERRKNDPRTAELKAKVKAARREASAQATERRKTDPKQVALKEKLKKERQAAAASGKEQRKARTAVAKKAERADKDEHLRLRIASADGGASLECIHGKPDVKALATTMPRSIAVGRAALTVIEGGKRPKTERPRSP
jgi:archaellum component FlaD/FlaE